MKIALGLATILLTTSISATTAGPRLAWDAPQGLPPPGVGQRYCIGLYRKLPAHTAWARIRLYAIPTTSATIPEIAPRPGYICYQARTLLQEVKSGAILQTSPAATVYGHPGCVQLCIPSLPPYPPLGALACES